MKSGSQINQHVMALITFLALVPLVYFIPECVTQFLPAIKWLNVVVEVGIIVPIISYGVVPMARFFFAANGYGRIAQQIVETFDVRDQRE